MENNFSDFLSQNWNDKFKSASLELQHMQSQQPHQNHNKLHFGQLLPIAVNSSSSPEITSQVQYDIQHIPTTSCRLTPPLSRSFFGDPNNPKFQLSVSQNVEHKISRLSSNFPHNQAEQMFLYRPLSISEPSQSTIAQPRTQSGGSKPRVKISESRCNFPTTTSTTTYQSMCSVNKGVVVDSSTPPPNAQSISSCSGVPGSSLSAVLAAVVSSVNDPERKAVNSIRGN